MTAVPLPAVRAILLGAAVLQALLGTVLFGSLERRLLRPWLALGDRHGRPAPALLRDARFARAWQLVLAVACGAFWWYTGTPGGAAVWARLAEGRP